MFTDISVLKPSFFQEAQVLIDYSHFRASSKLNKIFCYKLNFYLRKAIIFFRFNHIRYV
jgi:hypothetical protein